MESTQSRIFLVSRSLVETIHGRRRKLAAVVVMMAFAEFPVLQCVGYSDGRIWVVSGSVLL